MSSIREGVANAPKVLDAPSGCSNAVCGVVEAIEPVTAGKKTSHRLTVDVGEEVPLTVVSSTLVDVGGRIVVALAGSTVGDVELSQPKICDAVMLGWTETVIVHGPVLLPKSFSPGDAAPEERPKAGRAPATVDKLGNAGEVAGVEALFVTKPKLTKEDKEIAKLEKAAAKGDAKAAIKVQHLRLRQDIAARRASGEEVFTDDELEAAGLEPL